MLDTIESILYEFRDCFTRKRTFEWFVIVVIGFILRDDHLGVTSIIRILFLNPAEYELIIHFFHSDAYCLEDLWNKWYKVVFKYAPLIRKQGRIIMIGDGVKQLKEAFHMPAVKKLIQESEDSSKPQYIFGHMYGSIGILAGNLTKLFCIPLKTNIQDGLQSAAQWNGSHHSSSSHVVQMIVNAFEIIAGGDKRCYLLLDRYFLSVPSLQKLNELNEEYGSLIDIVTKAKSNCVAYERPGPRELNKKGRSRIKGRSVKLSSLFLDSDLFHSTRVKMYGEEKEVKIYCKNLLWGQGLYQELRFVLVISGELKSILVSTDLTLSPEDIVELYAYRFKIEHCFRTFKQTFCGFGYHFWTKMMPKLNHFAKKEEKDQLKNVTDEKARKKILEKIAAIERFVFCTSVAMGITQILSLTLNISPEEIRYQRTYTNKTPSEDSMIKYIQKSFFACLLKNPESRVSQLIQDIQNGSSRKRA